MDRLTSMTVFVRSVELGGFAAAAAELDLSPTMASKHVRALEARLGAKLLHRTTRRRSLTEVGREYFARCKAILAEVDAADATADELRAAPRGTLRIAAPLSFGTRKLAPALVEFLALYPDVHAELVLEDRVVDLITDRFDAAIRVGPLADSSLVARPLAPFRVWLCAAPAYLRAHGVPRTIRDLADHACIGFSGIRGRDMWQLIGRRGRARVPIVARYAVNHGEALREAALAGGGIVLTAEVLVDDDLRAGRLVRVLPSFEVPPRPMHVVTLPDRRPPPKLARFVEFVVARFRS